MPWSSPDSLLDGAVELASPPVIYQRLVEVIEDPRSHAGDLAGVISDDPALATRVLKIVNSAFFGFPRRVESISQAVTVIGMTQIRDLALATSVMALFENVSEDLVDVQSFWIHSLACGAGTRSIAVRRGEANAERFFIAGLIHDIGRLVMYVRAGEEMGRVVQLAHESDSAVWKAEREVFGFDHGQVGRALCRRWRLPPSCQEAVGLHHVPHNARQFPVETAAVHIADVVANAMRWGTSGEPRVPGFEKAAWDALGLEVETTSSLVQDIHQNLAGLSGLLPGKKAA